MKTIKKLMAVILALAMLAGFSAAAFAEESNEAYPLHDDYIWEVQGGESRIYLMGSMHLVLPGFAISPRVYELMLGCDALAVESDTENEALDEAIGAMAVYPDGDNLYAHLSQRGQAHMAWLCEQYGIAPWDIAELKPFVASSIFESLAAGAMGFIEGVDGMMQAQAEAARMPILELEDGAYIYERFLSLPDDTIERMCVLTLGSPDETIMSLLYMYSVYINGDADDMLAFVEDAGGAAVGGDGLPIEFEAKDALYDKYMLEDRNKNWIGVLETWLEMPDRDVFVVAGLGHFIGEGSVIELLEDEGYTVELVEFESSPAETLAA